METKTRDRIQAVKRLGLSALRQAGAFEVAKGSGWRSDRLVILCYHGVSLEWEHRWRPRLYVSPDLFRRRMELLDEGGYRVLPLDEALRRLYDGSLPERSVALTFDDGFHDFYARAYPVIEHFGYPVTVYLSTYYCVNRRPVFPLALDYVLWKGGGRRLRGVELMGETFDLDLRTAEGRTEALAELRGLVEERRCTDARKQELVEQLADVLDVDWASLRELRVVHLMSPDEVEELAGRGVDFQLHMHRHRSPDDEEAYRKEVRENRRVLASLTGETPRHFCYPSGNVRLRFARWLEREGVVSGTTDRAGVAGPDSRRMFLPRMLDHSGLSEVEFLAWTSGLARWLPRRVG